MFDAIVAVFVVVAVFSVVASLFLLYFWHADPYHFRMWRAMLRPAGERGSVRGPAPSIDRLRTATGAARRTVERSVAAVRPFGGLPTHAVVEPEVEAAVARQAAVLEWFIDNGAPTQKPKPARYH
jgi:hypothetical protein